MEQQIITWSEIKLSLNDLSKYNIIEDASFDDFIELTIPPNKSGYNENKDWIMSFYHLIFKRRNQRFNEIKESMGLNNFDPDSLTPEQLDDLSNTNKEYCELDRLYKKLDIFIKDKKHDNWIIEPWNDGLQMTPLNIAPFFKNYIDRMGVKKIVFLSATILDLPGFRETFGLDKDNTFLLKVDSNFDPNKSPIIYNPVCKMNYNSINDNLDKIKFAIEDILNKHPNEKGIIHTGNNTISKYLQENLNSNRLLVRYGDVVNTDIIKKHVSNNKPTVLVSSSLAEGVDLKNDLSRFQIIVKLPWVSLTDKRVKAKIEQDENWYAVEMFKKLIQQCGRSTRNEDDYSITYILDESFKYWFNKNKRKGWFSPQFCKRLRF